MKSNSKLFTKLILLAFTAQLPLNSYAVDAELPGLSKKILTYTCKYGTSTADHIISTFGCLSGATVTVPTVASSMMLKASDVTSETNSKDIMKRASSSASRIIAAGPEADVTQNFTDDENLRLAYYYLLNPTEGEVPFDGSLYQGAFEIIQRGK